jgi:hypothetical protein
MTKYKVKNSKLIIVATTTEEVVQQLNENSMFGFQDNLTNYMQKTSDAIKIQYEIDIDCTTPETFVNGLIENGLLIEDNFEDVV